MILSMMTHGVESSRLVKIKIPSFFAGMIVKACFCPTVLPVCERVFPWAVLFINHPNP